MSYAPVIPGAAGIARPAQRCDACGVTTEQYVRERHGGLPVVLCIDFFACNERTRGK